MALQTSKLISDIFYDERLSSFDHGRIAKKYEAKWNENFKKRLFTAGVIQKLILSSFFKNQAIGFARHFPPVLPYLLNNTRG
jgi:uncharacterized UPF0160 family protein